MVSVYVNETDDTIRTTTPYKHSTIHLVTTKPLKANQEVLPDMNSFHPHNVPEMTNHLLDDNNNYHQPPENQYGTMSGAGSWSPTGDFPPGIPSPLSTVSPEFGPRASPSGHSRSFSNYSQGAFPVDINGESSRQHDHRNGNHNLSSLLSECSHDSERVAWSGTHGTRQVNRDEWTTQVWLDRQNQQAIHHRLLARPSSARSLDWHISRMRSVEASAESPPQHTRSYSSSTAFTASRLQQMTAVERVLARCDSGMHRDNHNNDENNHKSANARPNKQHNPGCLDGRATSSRTNDSRITDRGGYDTSSTGNNNMNASSLHHGNPYNSRAEDYSAHATHIRRHLPSSPLAKAGRGQIRSFPEPDQEAQARLPRLTNQNVQTIVALVQLEHQRLKMKPDIGKYMRNSSNQMVDLVLYEVELRHTTHTGSTGTRRALFHGPSVTHTDGKRLVDLVGEYVMMRMDRGQDIALLKAVHGTCPVDLTERMSSFRHVLYHIMPNTAVDILVDKSNTEHQCMLVLMNKLQLHREVLKVFTPLDTSIVRLEYQQDGAKLTLLTENIRKLPKSQFHHFRKDVTGALIMAQLISERCFVYSHMMFEGMSPTTAPLESADTLSQEHVTQEVMMMAMPPCGPTTQAPQRHQHLEQPMGNNRGRRRQGRRNWT